MKTKCLKDKEKSLRDKEKEVKFLELAVEQGVVDQLDLDAAKEELAEMRSPLTQAEKDILDLQIKLAEAEKEVLEQISTLISPEIISSIDSYNKANNISSERAKDLTNKERELERDIEDKNMDLLDNRNMIEELKEEYPVLVGLLDQMSGLIGVPAGILSSYVNSMDASYTKFTQIADAINNTNINTDPAAYFPNIDPQPVPGGRRGPAYNPSQGLIIGGIQVIPLCHLFFPVVTIHKQVWREELEYTHL